MSKLQDYSFFYFWLQQNQANFIQTAFKEEKIKMEEQTNHLMKTIQYQKKSKQINIDSIKGKRDSKKSNNDEEFKINEKKEKKNKIMQKQGRNIFSNIIRRMIKYLKSPSAKKYHQKLQIHMQTEISLSDIENWFLQNDIHFQNYIRISTMKKMISKDLDEKGRVLYFHITHFLSNFCSLHFLTSHKMKDSIIVQSLSSMRTLKSDFLEIFSTHQQ